jgi:ABC-type multidrug transport system fused ATPase/permease subunit
MCVGPLGPPRPRRLRANCMRRLHLGAAGGGPWGFWVETRGHPALASSARVVSNLMTQARLPALGAINPCPRPLPLQGGTVLSVIIASLIGSFSLGLASPLLQTFSKGAAAAGRLFSVMERAPGIDASKPGLEPLRVEGAIELKNISFAYVSQSIGVGLCIRGVIKAVYLAMCGQGVIPETLTTCAWDTVLLTRRVPSRPALMC